MHAFDTVDFWYIIDSTAILRLLYKRKTPIF